MLVLDSTSQPPAFSNIQEFTVHICLTHNPTRTVQSLTHFVTHCLPNLRVLKLTSFADPLDYANFDDDPEYLKDMGLPIKRKELDIGLITKVVAFATKLRELTLPYGSDEMLLQLQHQYPLLYIKRD
ncbi:hypothetical protein GQ42DRAFT_165845 [Ramicandelaber brevisporus]|nr:hypothetical protein GQ42DRAFT_165845 [Ramicandelaber brevisporus]